MRYESIEVTLFSLSRKAITGFSAVMLAGALLPLHTYVVPHVAYIPDAGSMNFVKRGITSDSLCHQCLFEKRASSKYLRGPGR